MGIFFHLEKQEKGRLRQFRCRECRLVDCNGVESMSRERRGLWRGGERLVLAAVRVGLVEPEAPGADAAVEDFRLGEQAEAALVGADEPSQPIGTVAGLMVRLNLARIS